MRRVGRVALLYALVVFVGLSKIAEAHSWVEALRVISANGTFTGGIGYIRGFIGRNDTGFVESSLLNLLPPDDNSRGNSLLKNDTLLPTDPMCAREQANTNPTNQTAGYPRLQAYPGAMVALQYEENGHVTQPWNQAGKPANRGTVYIYGTSNPKTDEKFLDVHGPSGWNIEGTGGDGRGRLIGTNNFDDGQCYQISNSNISTTRQSMYPFVSPGPSEYPFKSTDLACQNNIRLPQDLPTGQPYTLYWVWDWPTAVNTSTSPVGKFEIYTSCMDIDINLMPGGNKTTKNNKLVPVSYAKVDKQNRPVAAISSYFAGLNSGSVLLAATGYDEASYPPTQTATAAIGTSDSFPATITATNPSTTAPLSTTIVTTGGQEVTVYAISTIYTTVDLGPSTALPASTTAATSPLPTGSASDSAAASATPTSSPSDSSAASDTAVAAPASSTPTDMSTVTLSPVTVTEMVTLSTTVDAVPTATLVTDTAGSSLPSTIAVASSQPSILTSMSSATILGTAGLPSSLPSASLLGTAVLPSGVASPTLSGTASAGTGLPTGSSGGSSNSSCSAGTLQKRSRIIPEDGPLVRREVKPETAPRSYRLSSRRLRSAKFLKHRHV